MKTLFRTLLYLALIVWLGAEVFFPFVAAVTFMTLQPNTHVAGTIVGALLRSMHSMGLVSGVVLLVLLALAPVWRIYKSRVATIGMVLVALMIACTAYSQFVIIPTMERDRLATGGDVNAAAATDPGRIDFNRLHRRSENVEMAVLLLGLATVVTVAYAESSGTDERDRSQLTGYR